MRPNVNAALSGLEFLVGDWNTTGTHPMMPGVELHGRAKFEWIEDGAFLIMHAHIDDPRFPTGVAIFGTDNGTGECFMLYSDERGVSRKYDVVIEDHGFRWERFTTEFSQRFTVTAVNGAEQMVSKGEMSRDGGAWEGDLSLVYTRTKR